MQVKRQGEVQLSRQASGWSRMCGQAASPAVANNVNHNVLLVLCSPVSRYAAGSHHSFGIVCIHVKDGRPAPFAQTDKDHVRTAPHAMHNVLDAFSIANLP